MAYGQDKKQIFENKCAWLEQLLKKTKVIKKISER